MTFKPYHYDHVNDLLRYYASSMARPDIIAILDNGISSERDAQVFCEFIPLLLDQRLVDEESGNDVPVENGSATIADLHHEAGSFVCDAGFEPVWDAMLSKL
ncbi:hypothetical protein E4656_06510 [Natronospirillum operosum]|uniref:Uncharacterized protein n=1 Tax=Natronospirillum operosum TaxID=2759953 RepID=A0A4Z0WCK7_9GAMM|nr:hypothetical protein [Natronospirillum operosum]TGG93843.1 hypothetical protein E4656_06510 [Natronospirillum operosum]